MSASMKAPGNVIVHALTMFGKPVYRGTVPAHVKARRRAKNKAARAARKAGRS